MLGIYGTAFLIATRADAFRSRPADQCLDAAKATRRPGLITRLIARIRDGLRREQDMKILGQLDDRTLKDIGLSRVQLSEEIRKGGRF